MTAPVATRTASWYPSEGLLQRGTVVLLPGRGEHPGVYERLGRRLSADAYVVHVLELDEASDTERTASDIAQVAQGAAAPLVLAGSDTGALRALAVAAHPSAAPDALLLVGVPSTGDAPSTGDWEQQLTARTACPTHRGRLAADPLFDRTALDAPVAPDLASAAEEAVPQLAALPVLLVHGEADPVSPVATARELAARLPEAALATVADGRHDSLNDISHRSVAATVVLWLERLRAGAHRSAVVTLQQPSDN